MFSHNCEWLKIEIILVYHLNYSKLLKVMRCELGGHEIALKTAQCMYIIFL